MPRNVTHRDALKAGAGRCQGRSVEEEMDQQRQQAFQKRREALAKVSDAQLKDRFWELCHQVVAPMVKLAEGHTSPSIERSVLLRMGIDSITATGVVGKVTEAGLLGKGAGHVILKVSEKCKLDTRAAAKKIVDDPKVLDGLFPAKK